MIQRSSRVRSRGGFTFCVTRNFGRETRPEELADQALEGAAGDTDEGVIARKFSWTVGVRVIERRDRTGGGVAGDMRVVGLPAAIVSAGHEAGEQGVLQSRLRGIGRAHVEVAGVLAKDGGEHSRAQSAPDEGVSVGCAVALAITFGTLAVAGKSVVGLLNSCDQPGGKEGNRVGSSAGRKLELLPRIEWSGVPQKGGIEVGKDTGDALRCLEFYLVVRDLRLRQDYVHNGAGRGDGQCDCREFVLLPHAQNDGRRLERLQSWRGYDYGVAAWSEIMEQEVTFTV